VAVPQGLAVVRDSRSQVAHSLSAGSGERRVLGHERWAQRHRAGEALAGRLHRLENGRMSAPDAADGNDCGSVSATAADTTTIISGWPQVSNYRWRTLPT